MGVMMPSAAVLLQAAIGPPGVTRHRSPFVHDPQARGYRLSPHGHPRRTGPHPLRARPPRRRAAPGRPARLARAPARRAGPGAGAAPARPRPRGWSHSARTARTQARRNSDGPAARVRDVFKPDFDAPAAPTCSTTAAPFRERLVWFWANHFTVSVRRGECYRGRAALRPRGDPPPRHRPLRRHAVRGDAAPGDADLSRQRRLDRPGQPGGPAQSHRGLNENLARECLELHTVSPAAGYTQADVTEFAKMLTGWSFEINYNPPQFRVPPATRTSPARRRVMGQTFPHGRGGRRRRR